MVGFPCQSGATPGKTPSPMKTTLLFLALASSAIASQPVLVRITPDTLARIKAREPMVRVVDSASNSTAVQPSPFKDSTILHDGKNWTLVPNGSLVNLPDAMKCRVNLKPVGTLLTWSEFQKKNSTWIDASEVGFDLAVGNAELSADSTKAWAKTDKIVVTVHQNEPAVVRVAVHMHSLTCR